MESHFSSLAYTFENNNNITELVLEHYNHNMSCIEECLNLTPETGGETLAAYVEDF